MKPGDQITLSISPTLQYADYKYLKPHASLSRTLGPDPAASLAEMEADLKKLAVRALAVEIALLTELDTVVQNEGPQGLVDYCLRGQPEEGSSHVSERQTQAEQGEPEQVQTRTPIRRRPSKESPSKG